MFRIYLLHKSDLYSIMIIFLSRFKLKHLPLKRGSLRTLSTFKHFENVKQKSSWNFQKPTVQKEFPMERIRNIGIMAHIDAGKTTTTERMLYYTGYTRSIGDVDDGDTVMDYMEQEQDRGITITSAAITFMWNQHRVNLIDTPGHVDFTLEVERSLRVLDGAVALLDASAGVEAQTLTVWRQADHYKVPCIAYLNKMDKPAASFTNSVTSMVDKLHVNPLVTQVPIGSGSDFRGIVDIVNMEKCVWKNDGEGKLFEKSSLESSDELYEQTLKSRMKLIETLADVNETIAEHFLNDVDHLDIPRVDIHNAIRAATLSRKVVPVLCGSSYKNKGVQPLLDAVIKYLPSPLEIHHDFVDYYKDKLCALAFKLVHHKHHGPLTFMRLYEGELKSGMSIYNVNRECTEKVTRVLQVYADEHKEISHASSGNIVAVSGLKETITGDTLVTNHAAAVVAESRRSKDNKTYEPELDSDGEDSQLSAPVLAGMIIPDPVFFCSVEVESLAYQKQLDLALANLTREDPSLRVRIDKDTGQTILSGMGELHLDIIKSRIEKEYKAEVYLGPMQISYRESVTEASEETVVTLDNVIGKDRHVVTVGLSLKPSSSNFKSIEIPHDLDIEIIRKLRTVRHRALNSGVKSALSRGPILGFPVINVAVTLHNFQMKHGTSLSMLTGAASQAVYQALQQASATLLEPMMNMEIWTEESYLSNVMADLNRRRAQILAMASPHPDTRIVHALVPLAELRGYSTTLRTVTSGRGSFTMELAYYAEMAESERNQATLQHTGFAPIV